jgi:hypothetical protein
MKELKSFSFFLRTAVGSRMMAILGSAAHLPCNITPPVIGKSIHSYQEDLSFNSRIWQHWADSAAPRW